MRSNYKKVEFTYKDLSEKAFGVYSNSDFTFYVDSENLYFLADNQNATPYEIGTIADVEEYLLQFAEVE